MLSKMRLRFMKRSLMLPAPPLAAIFLLLTVGLGNSITSGQDQLRHDVAVSLKLFQVFVTDKAGNPVRDLTLDDFTLLVDGKPVTLTDFERHELKPVAAPVVAGEAAAPAPTAVPPERPVAALGRKFILFFDMSYNTVQGILAGRKAALHFLDKHVGPGDEVGLMTMSTVGGLKVREYLTKDLAKVKRAVADLSSREHAGRADQVERAYWQIAEIAKELEGQEADQRNVQKQLAALESQRKESKLQAEDYIEALTGLAMSLRLVPGQKTLVFFRRACPTP